MALGVTVAQVRFANQLVADDEFCSRVGLLAERLGSVHVVASPHWQNLARQFDLDSDEADGVALVVGSPAEVLRHADATTEEFGFVTPVAQMSKWWQRSPSWRDETTLDLWRAGWSPLTIDRILVPTAGAVVEFVVGSARRIPESADPAR